MPVPRPWAVLRTVLLLLPVALLGDRLALFATHSAEMIAFPWQIDFDEGVILHGAWLLAGGHTPYPPLTPDHFVSAVYPPLFYLLNVVPLQVWGLNLWSGRAWSLAGALLAAVALVAWTRAETRSAAAGVVAAALWLALGPVIVWATFYKQDVLALGFELLGGALVGVACPPRTPAAGPAAGPRGDRLPRAAWWAILPLVLAFWTKQSALPALGACALYLLARDRRQGLPWTAAAAVALIGPFVLVDRVLGGQLVAHLFLPGAEAPVPARLAKNLGVLWDEHWPLAILAAVAAAGVLVAAARGRRPPALSLLFAGVSIPAVVWTNLSPLANYNHLLPALLPMCLLAGVGLGHAVAVPARGAPPAARPRVPRAGWGRWLPLAGALVLLLAQPALFTPIKSWYTPLGQPLAEKADRFARLEAAIAAVPGTAMLSEDAWLVLKAGKTLPFDDPAMMTIQAEHGRWDESAFLAAVARRQFGMVVLEHDITNETFTPRWTPAALAALQANYAVKFRDVRFLEVPRPPPATPQGPLACTLPGGPRLAGVFLPGGGARLAAGDAQQLSLYWAAPGTGAPAADLKFSLRLLDPGGAPAWQADLPPGAAAGHPWPDWGGAPGQRDDLLVLVPPGAAPGAYTLTLSAYAPAGGQLVPLAFTCTDRPGGPALVLATPQVVRLPGEP